VLPGVIDAHTHLCLDLRLGNEGLEGVLRTLLVSTLIDTTAHRAVIGTQMAREMLEAGFTTVRDVGNAGNYADTALRLGIEEGRVVGPTMINAGRIIGPFGGQYHHLQPEQPHLGEPEYLYADTPDEMRKAVRENVRFGAKVIKIAVDDQPYLYSVEDVRTIVAESARAGARVAAHCATDAGARNAAEGGVASVEHGYRASTETLQIMKRKGVVLVGTDFTREQAHAMGMDPYHQLVVERLRRALAVGTTMAYGTDIVYSVPGETRGTLSMQTIDSFAEAGVPPRVLLQAMTINAARLLGVDKERGAIKPGLAADLIATPEDPLDNPGTLKHVVFVMKEGRVVKAP
jgi:imidazolonepropionase-like amidohydrolase